MDNQLIFPPIIDDESGADISFDEPDTILPEDYIQRAQHPISEAMAELMRGKPKERAIRLFILKTIANQTHALTGEGQAEWPTLDDLERDLQEYRLPSLSGLVQRMQQRGLLEIYDRPYRYGLTPAASTILAFFHLVFDFHDESGLASAIIANINLIQFRKTANASIKELRLVFRDILYDIGRLNLKLETALQNRIRSELDLVSADLEVIQAYLKPLRELADQFASHAQDHEIDSGRIVAWLNHGRQIINRFEKLAHSITSYYLLRAGREADGHLAIDNIEAMLADYANDAERWPQIIQWGRQLDKLVALGHISLQSLLEAYQAQFAANDNLATPPVPTTSVTVEQEKIYRWSEDDDVEAEILANWLQYNGPTRLADLVDADSWSTTAGRICALDDALELLKDRTGAGWGVSIEPGVTTFPDQAGVKRITNGKIDIWVNLNASRYLQMRRNGN